MHIARVLLAVVGCGSTAVLAGPVPKADGKAPLYYPIKEGTKLVYETTVDNAKAREKTETVVKVEAKGAGFLVTTEGPPIKTTPGGAEMKPQRVREVSAKGVTPVAGKGKGLPAPRPILKLPAKEGDTWTDKQDNHTHTYTVGKEEAIEVPAGKFKAIPVTDEYAVTGPGGKEATMRVTTWYAPDVGEVKHVSKLPSGQEVKTVLKSITPGK